MEGDLEMKKFLACTAIIGGIAGTVAYMNKNGLPILGNLTMKGIEVAEGLNKKKNQDTESIDVKETGSLWHLF